MEEIRLLTAQDIDVRVAQTTNYNGGVQVSLLLYKDARVDMKILDELFTPMGWKRSHKLIGDRLYCEVSVWDEKKGEWVSKEDVGVESNTEAEKGQASDSFKRACFNWGIGRELYTAPKIVIDLNEKEYNKGNDGRIRVWASFKVSDIGYDKSRSITSLTIVDKFGNPRFTMGEQKKPTKRATKATTDPEYTPMTDTDYRNIVKAYAIGMLTKTGGDYRQTWIDMTHAKEGHILQFDHDVERYRTTGQI